MPAFRPSHVYFAPGLPQNRLALKALAQRARPPPFPIVPSCPSPTCECAEMPAGLDIDYSKDLNGTMSPYSQHVLISTGQSDWKSKIEDEAETAPWGKFTADLKAAFGRNGQFHDPYSNILISASSFSHHNTPASATSIETLLFPSFRRVQANIGQEEDVSQFIKSFMLAEKHPQTESHPASTQSITSPTLLVCSHGSRDNRCGVLGPLLHAEFVRFFSEYEPLQLKFAPRYPEFNSNAIDATSTSKQSIPVNVGMISHVGGHKWAGNIILYIPPSFEAIPGTINPLSGNGIWYGRVEPKHIQGIIEETLIKGKVIKDLFRGGINEKGQPLRV